MKHIKGLDTLRAFAVFFVLVEHKGVWFDDTVPNGRFIKQVLIPDGGFGVFLFFVLSGFLITNILLQQRNVAAENRLHVIRNFFVRRTLRIFPIYYLLLLFLYLIHFPGLAQYMPYYLTYTTNILVYRTNQWNSFSHAWTLAVEEQFYLIWPWLIIFLQERYLKYLFGASIIIGVVSTWYCMGLRGHMGPFLVFNCFDSFGLGGLFAYVYTTHRHSRSFHKALQWSGIAALAIYLYWKLCAFYSIAPYGLVFQKLVDSILALCLIQAVVLAKPSRFRRYFLENSVLVFVGRISYGIYLYHYVYNALVYYQLVDYLSNITQGYPSLNALVRDTHFYYWLHIVLIIAISAGSNYLIELPILRFKRFFGYREKATDVSVPYDSAGHA